MGGVDGGVRFLLSSTTGGAGCFGLEKPKVSPSTSSGGKAGDSPLQVIDMPEDVLANIGSFLDPVAVINASVSCKSLMAIKPIREENARENLISLLNLKERIAADEVKHSPLKVEYGLSRELTFENAIELPEASAPTKCLAFHPSGKRFVAVDDLGSIRIWNLQKDGQWCAVRVGEANPNWTYASFGPDGSTLLAVQRLSNRAELWEEGGSGEWRTIVLSGHESYVEGAAFNYAGDRVAIESQDSTVKVWSRNKVNRDGWSNIVLKGHVAPVTHCTFGSDDQEMITFGEDGRILSWAMNDAGDWKSESFQESASFASMDATASGNEIVAADCNGLITFWQRSGDSVDAWESSTFSSGFKFMNDVKLSPDGKHFIGLSEFGNIGMWSRGAAGDWSRGIDERFTRPAHKPEVRVNFSPDSRYAVVTGLARFLAWKYIETKGWEPLNLDEPDYGVEHLAFSPDGMLMVIAGSDGKTRVVSRV